MSRQERLRARVEALCAPECNGRAPGTPGSAAARAQIVAAFEAAGAEPAGDDGYLQRVPGCGHNVLARVPGAGANAERAVLVAAHYDHLGEGPHGEVYWGADDNAAAVAILLDLVERLVERRDELDRQVLLAAFDGEEPPHFLQGTMGSMVYAARPALPLERHDAMVCMDLVGHAIGPPAFPDAVRRSVFLLGAELSEGTGALCDAVAERVEGVHLRRVGLDVIPPLSDYYAFVERQVPSLFLTCGRWEHYHTPQDTPEKLDYPKVAATADALLELTLALSRRPEPRVRFVPGGRDDAAALASLRTLAELLRPSVPLVAQALPVLNMLERAAASGPLSDDQHGLIALLVGQLEQLFA